jgi:hypothetical protein
MSVLRRHLIKHLVMKGSAVRIRASALPDLQALSTWNGPLQRRRFERMRTPRALISGRSDGAGLLDAAQRVALNRATATVIRNAPRTPLRVHPCACSITMPARLAARE